MFNLSKSNFLHSLLNRKYNLIIKFILSLLGWTISFLLILNLRISNFIFKNIFLGNDLKNEIRRLFWIFKITYFGNLLSLDMMYDFCYGLDHTSLNFFKRKLEKKINRDHNILLKLDLLKILAYQINYSDPNANNRKILLKNFRDFYFEIKRVILSTKKYQVLKKQNISKSKKISNQSKNIKKAFLDLDSFFELCRVEWFPISGTLLGFIREGKLLENDLDIDIGIMEDSISMETLKKLIVKSSSFKVSRVEYQKNFIQGYESSLKPVFLRLVHSNGINVDVFYHYSLGDKIYHGTSSLLWENNSFKLSCLESTKSSMKIPHESEQYLSETYGNWKIEARDYNYHRDMLSLTGANNYLGIEYLLRRFFYCGRSSKKQIEFLENLLL